MTSHHITQRPEIMAREAAVRAADQVGAAGYNGTTPVDLRGIRPLDNGSRGGADDVVAVVKRQHEQLVKDMQQRLDTLESELR